MEETIGDLMLIMMIIMEVGSTVIKVEVMEKNHSLMLDTNHLVGIVLVMGGNKITITTIMIEVVAFSIRLKAVLVVLQIVGKTRMLDGRVINKIVTMIMKVKEMIMSIRMKKL